MKIKARKIFSHVEDRWSLYCFRNILHLSFKDGTNEMLGNKMCSCGALGMSRGTEEEKELSRGNVEMIRDYLDEELFYYSPTDFKSVDRRQAQRETIKEFARELKIPA